MWEIKKLTIIICGGDDREKYIYNAWKERGFKVRLFGSSLRDNLHYGHDTTKYDDIATLDSLTGVDVLVLPVWGINCRGNVTEKPGVPETDAVEINISRFLQTYRGQNLLVISGKVDEHIRSLVPPVVHFFNTLQDEELKQLNAIPTAEGVIMNVIRKYPRTIHGSKCLVIGLGKCGMSIAQALKALGGDVTVAVRRTVSRAFGLSLNYKTILINEIPQVLPEIELIFNTVPAIILTKDLLSTLKSGLMIFDVASSPGGVDLNEATKREIPVYNLPGLPGKVAPDTAGQILLAVYERVMKQHFRLPG